jgi:hypothetical protein
VRPSPVAEEIWRSWAALADDDNRRAFFRTLNAMPKHEVLHWLRHGCASIQGPAEAKWGYTAPGVLEETGQHAAHPTVVKTTYLQSSSIWGYPP